MTEPKTFKIDAKQYMDLIDECVAHELTSDKLRVTNQSLKVAFIISIIALVVSFSVIIILIAKLAEVT